MGVQLAFQNETGTLSYFRNGHFIGKLDSKLVGTFFPAVTFFASGSKVSLDHSQPSPSN